MNASDTTLRKYQETLEQVRRNFENALDDYRREFASYSDMLMDNGTSQAGLKGMQMRAHKIKGIASTLGYAELGEAASRLESVVMTMLGGAVDNIDETANEFVACFRRMETALAANIGGH